MIDETTIIHYIPCFFFLVFGQARSFSSLRGVLDMAIRFFLNGRQVLFYVSLFLRENCIAGSICVAIRRLLIIIFG